MAIILNFLGLVVFVGGILFAYYVGICKMFVGGIALAISNTAIVNGALVLDYSGAYMPAILMFFSTIVVSIICTVFTNIALLFFTAAKEY